MESRCEHDKRFTGVFFTKNGCIACEAEQLAAENMKLKAELAALRTEVEDLATYSESKCVCHHLRDLAWPPTKE